MARLEDLTIGSVVTGRLPNEPIIVVSTRGILRLRRREIREPIYRPQV